MSKRRDSVYEGIYSPFLNNQSRDRKVIIERMYQRILTELSVNRFKWVGLPDSVDERFLEMTLFHQALSIFYWDRDYNKFLAVRGHATGPNMYDNPTRFHTYGVGKYKGKTLSSKAAVPIWANYLRIPDHDVVYLYATKLAELDRTISINILNARNTHILFVDEEERLSVQNMMRQHREGEPLIYGTRGAMGMMERIQAFPIDVDKDKILNLQLVKDKLWNECMTLLGIKNANQDKKERMVVDEVNANDDQVVSSRGVSLNARRQAVEIINAKWELDISVGWNEQADIMARDAVQTHHLIGAGRF